MHDLQEILCFIFLAKQNLAIVLKIETRIFNYSYLECLAQNKKMEESCEILVLNYHETDTPEFNFYYIYSNILFTNSCKQERIDKVYKYIVY